MPALRKLAGPPRAAPWIPGTCGASSLVSMAVSVFRLQHPVPRLSPCLRTLLREARISSGHSGPQLALARHRGGYLHTRHLIPNTIALPTVSCQEMAGAGDGRLERKRRQATRTGKNKQANQNSSGNPYSRPTATTRPMLEKMAATPSMSELRNARGSASSVACRGAR
jgi:hypothetical protein